MITDNMGKKTLTRFIRYSLVGSSTFPIDIALLWFFVSTLGINYLLATGIAFVIAVSINYSINRPWAFYGTRRGFWGGYGFFICVGTFVALLTVLFTGLLTNWAGIHFLIARVLVAGFIGILGFFINLYFIFKVAESQEGSATASL
ncbi:MAG: GtrA family protein [Patescibacteria group bacterium]